MAYLPGARQERFTAEETDVLVRAVKDREVVLYGDGRNPPKIASVKQAWEEIATIVSSIFFFSWFLTDKPICQMSLYTYMSCHCRANRSDP